VVIKD